MLPAGGDAGRAPGQRNVDLGLIEKAIGFLAAKIVITATILATNIICRLMDPR